METKEENQNTTVIQNEDLIQITIDQDVIKTSRKLLIAKSAYFRAMLSPNHEGFIETKQSNIVLKDVDAAALSVILKHLRLKQGLESENFNFFHNFSLSVLVTAAMLQFTEVLEECKTLATYHMSIDTYLEYVGVSKQLGALELWVKANFLSAWEFYRVIRTEGFLALPECDLKTYLSNEMLRIPDEMAVAEALMGWIDSQEDSSSLVSLLDCVHWRNMSLTEVRTITLYPQVRRNTEALNILKQIICLKQASGETEMESENSDTIIDESLNDLRSAREAAIRLLQVPARQQPLVPCFIGHRNTEIKIALPNGIYVMGGSYLLSYNDWNLWVWRYDTLSKLWGQAGMLRNPRRQASLCVIGDLIYMVGGCGKHRIISNICEAYSTLTEEWRQCALMPEALLAPACCEHLGRIFIFGCKVYCYSPELNLWSTLSALEVKRDHYHSAMSDGKNIYLTGKYSKSLLYFCPEEVERASYAELSEAGNFSSNVTKACLIANHIYAFCDDKEGELLVESYDICSGQFEVLWKNKDTTTPFVDFAADHTSACFPLLKCW
ncbi:hypothetical protein B566_EDAN005173 [Ephemera danica]|nr:hypothetical protein B566_EDAN005173 [Ephemera danica]